MNECADKKLTGLCATCDALTVKVAELEAVYKHARGMCFGVDWNNGTAAGHHREALIAAVNTIEALPAPPTEDKPERNTCDYLAGDLCMKQGPCDCYPPDTTEDKSDG